ncbi:MAG: PstS family phosphate ABC transporter substrate-binding protein [Rhodocyclaceae bacterium]|nr:PstS family phosphate ABC transporter substrate-binding protein [Rhodocyclaceae bacterium]
MSPAIRCGCLSVLLSLLVAGCAPSESRALVRIDGSSTVYPITEAVAEEFQKARERRTWVTVGVSGTGGGFRKFCRGELDIVDASRPITATETAACRASGIDYLALPVALDALTVVVGPRNPVSSITIAELRRIWAPEAHAQVLRWPQVNPHFPDLPLKLYGPGTDSGSFEYFTEAIVGRARASRSDYTASEDDNLLVTGVASDPGALAYFGLAYYRENAHRLKVLGIVPPEGGEPVLPSVDNVRAGRYRPLARSLYIYVNGRASTRPEVRDFVRYYLARAPELVDEVRYVPLAEARYAEVREAFEHWLAGGRPAAAVGERG